MDATEFAARLERARARVAAACRRAGRDPAEVAIVAVAKNFGPQDVAVAAACGQTRIGESKVQEARQKIPLCPGGVEWHMVGHLQTNKARDAARLFGMIHSVDSERLLRALDAACGEAGVRMPVCLQVNVSGESSKFGLPPEDGPSALEACAGLACVEVVGLMTIPPFSRDAEEARPHFRRLRELRDRWRAAAGGELAHLSMGMSDDFEVAVEEGATLVRLGTALFGARNGRGAGARAAAESEATEQ
ncbi:MAG: YggS family pyridoxal phosphate-dependent enzyme [Lentisphaerae bacterium]|nr:YggS family pyridoxal phosphate-dependent enzyme [Lentisphaerota bacterium]